MLYQGYTAMESIGSEQQQPINLLFPQQLRGLQQDQQQQEQQQQQQQQQHGQLQRRLSLVRQIVLPTQQQIVPMDSDLGCSVESVPNATQAPSVTMAADSMRSSTDCDTDFSMGTLIATALLPGNLIEYDNNPSNVTTGGDLLVESNNLQEELSVPEASGVFNVDEFLSPETVAEEISATEHTRQENGRDNDTNIRSRIANQPQERRNENLCGIMEIVLSEESRNNRYSGYSMLLQFVRNTENNIYNAANGESEYSRYITETVRVVQRTFEEWKHDNPDKEFSVGRDLFGMNMQDLINKANQKCASVLSNPITTLVLSNPITTPVFPNLITTLSSESTVAVNQPPVSTVDSSNEHRRNNHRSEPYPSTTLTYSRNSRHYRSRQYTRVYRVCYYSKNRLPLRVNHFWRTCLILETDIHIFLDDEEADIRGKLVIMLVVKHGYHHITEDDLVFLKSARGQLDLPISPPGFEWDGDKLRRLIGNGKLHVMVRVNRETDSSFGTSCVFSECERHDSRRSSAEFMEEEDAENEAMRRSVAFQGQPSGPNAYVSPQESKDKSTGALREHADKVVKGSKRYITVKREDLWNSALEFFKKPNFIKEFGTLSVKFQIQDGITEEASDFSGPKREFFRLLIREICQRSGAFLETPNGLVPRNNIRQLEEGVLRHVGRMISTMVIQGGEAPAIFSPIITQCILKDPISTKPEVDDIPDLIVRESLYLVQEATDQASLERALNSCEWRFHVDGLPLFVKLENKEDFVLSSAVYFAVVQRQTGIQQLLEGFEYYDFLGLMRRKPFICDILEYKKEDVSAKELISMMKPEYSFTESKREKEEKLYSNLKDFLQLVEGKTLLQRLDDDFIVLTAKERDFISTMKPSKLLEFCTGSSKVPALGFEEDPHVTFSDNNKKFHPSAHTCGNKLVMYVNDKTINDKSNFFKIMVETLMNAEHFGFS